MPAFGTAVLAVFGAGLLLGRLGHPPAVAWPLAGEPSDPWFGLLEDEAAFSRRNGRHLPAVTS